jgi:hypothetical protein
MRELAVGSPGWVAVVQHITSLQQRLVELQKTLNIFHVERRERFNNWEQEQQISREGKFVFNCESYNLIIYS